MSKEKHLVQTQEPEYRLAMKDGELILQALLVTLWSDNTKTREWHDIPTIKDQSA